MDTTKRQQKTPVFIAIVHKLLARTTKLNVDVQSVKALRYKYFQMLVNIYDEMLPHTHTKRLDQVYDILMELGVKMVEAMKRSHTGNNRIHQSFNCYCSDGASRLVHSSPNCNKACQIGFALMRYSCNNSGPSIFLTNICNGIEDCPSEEDEMNCGLGKI